MVEGADERGRSPKLALWSSFMGLSELVTAAKSAGLSPLNPGGELRRKLCALSMCVRVRDLKGRSWNSRDRPFYFWG